MGEVVQLQGDQRKDVQDFLTDKKEGLGLDSKTIKVSHSSSSSSSFAFLPPSLSLLFFFLLRKGGKHDFLNLSI